MAMTFFFYTLNMCYNGREANKEKGRVNNDGLTNRSNDGGYAANGLFR